MSGDFGGKIVVVTGASTGLGRAIALEVAGRGARAVVVNYANSASEAEETAKPWCARRGPKRFWSSADVGEDEGCIAIAKAADRLRANRRPVQQRRRHPVCPRPFANMDAVSADDFLAIYRINVVGGFQMVRAARSLLEAGESPGAVVMTSSIAGVAGIGSSVAYAASKGALNTMTISLARALAPKIRVNAVCPGFIDTPWFGRGLDEDALERMRAGVAASTPLEGGLQGGRHCRGCGFSGFARPRGM